jgi:hypothetical protein
MARPKARIRLQTSGPDGATYLCDLILPTGMNMAEAQALYETLECSQMVALTLLSRSPAAWVRTTWWNRLARRVSGS